MTENETLVHDMTRQNSKQERLMQERMVEQIQIAAVSWDSTEMLESVVTDEMPGSHVRVKPSDQLSCPRSTHVNL